MKGNLKMSEAQKAEWTYWTARLRQSVKNLGDIEIVAAPVEYGTYPITLLEKRIMNHYDNKYGAVVMCAKAIGITYNRMYCLLHKKAKWREPEIKSITKLLELTPEERRQFFG